MHHFSGKRLRCLYEFHESKEDSGLNNKQQNRPFIWGIADDVLRDLFKRGK